MCPISPPASDIAKVDCCVISPLRILDLVGLSPTLILFIFLRECSMVGVWCHSLNNEGGRLHFDRVLHTRQQHCKVKLIRLQSPKYLKSFSISYVTQGQLMIPELTSAKYISSNDSPKGAKNSWLSERKLERRIVSNCISQIDSVIDPPILFFLWQRTSTRH